jgi:hypothetical protein
MVIRFPYGQRNELLEMAEVTRSLLSLTAVSGSPTTAILSVFPHPACTSISTSNASTPTTAAEYTFDGISEHDIFLLYRHLKEMFFYRRGAVRPFIEARLPAFTVKSRSVCQDTFVNTDLRRSLQKSAQIGRAGVL